MLKIGVVGAGHLGKIHLNQIKEIADYQLIGFHDSSPETRSTVSDSLQVKPFESLIELISCCDVIDVVTPTFAHMDVAAEAIRQSKHVFIEKPLANTPEEGRQIAELAREAGVIEPLT